VGRERDRERESEEERPNIGRPHLRLVTNHNPPPLSCHLLQWDISLLEWIQHAGGSTTWGLKRFDPKCPESKEDLLALTALQLENCNISGNQRTSTHPVSVASTRALSPVASITLYCLDCLLVLYFYRSDPSFTG
jgi:hypothetical protein